MSVLMQTNELWSIVLSGGEGERLKPFIQQWLGQHKPKQYCAFVGTRSMFQHTLDRADLLSPPGRRVTVIAKSHREEALPQLAGRPFGKVIVQPTNRNTAAGVFLAASYVRACNPHATVVIFPSDHFVYPEDRFLKAVGAAIRATDLLRNHLVLLGVPANGIELDYGWVQLGARLGALGEFRLTAVEAFLEKPNQDIAERALLSGALWNTLIVAARVETLWAMGWRYFPDLMELFEKYTAYIGTSKEDATLEAIYRVMPVRNISSHLLQNVSQHIAAIEMSGVLWCDWGRPERILHTLARIGKRPLHSWEHAAASSSSIPSAPVPGTDPDEAKLAFAQSDAYGVANRE